MNEEKIWIQILLLLGVAVVTVLLTRSTADARHQAVRRVLLALFALVTAAAILFPTILSRIAALVGVGRGTDLLLYLLVIAFLSFIATTYRRMKATDRTITELTRELALTEARLERAGLPTAHHAADGGAHPGTHRPPADPAGQAERPAPAATSPAAGAGQADPPAPAATSFAAGAAQADPPAPPATSPDPDGTGAATTPETPGPGADPDQT